VPLPWDGDRPPFGFGAAAPWLPQPADWAGLTVARQEADPSSTLALYRAALPKRRELFGEGRLEWEELGEDVLAFRRDGVRCVLNLSAAPVPVRGTVEATSAPIEAGMLPVDAACWLRAGA
jgi:alpha-glucosidase